MEQIALQKMPGQAEAREDVGPLPRPAVAQERWQGQQFIAVGLALGPADRAAALRADIGEIVIGPVRDAGGKIEPEASSVKSNSS